MKEDRVAVLLLLLLLLFFVCRGGGDRELRTGDTDFFIAPPPAPRLALVVFLPRLIPVCIDAHMEPPLPVPYRGRRQGR